MTPATDTREFVSTIAQQLGETQPSAILQLRRIVQRLGPDATLAFLKEAHAINAMGIWLLPSGRPRTPGGIFFRLVKDRISPDDRAAIFLVSPAYQPYAAGPTGAVIPPQNELDSIPNTNGEVRTVKITLVGRPGRLVAKHDYLMTTMTSTKTPPLPKGLPTPTDAPTSYTVYINTKQWAKVAKAIRQPDDLLIVEGYPAYDPTLEGIAVYAISVTTKQIQQAQRLATQQTT